VNVFSLEEDISQTSFVKEVLLPNCVNVIKGDRNTMKILQTLVEPLRGLCTKMKLKADREVGYSGFHAEMLQMLSACTLFINDSMEDVYVFETYDKVDVPLRIYTL
jgi:hypothetical protein